MFSLWTGLFHAGFRRVTSEEPCDRDRSDSPQLSCDSNQLPCHPQQSKMVQRVHANASIHAQFLGKSRQHVNMQQLLITKTCLFIQLTTRRSQRTVHTSKTKPYILPRYLTYSEAKANHKTASQRGGVPGTMLTPVPCVHVTSSSQWSR